jgi:hypothetical protein
VKQISPGVLEWTSPLGHVIRSDGTRGDDPPGPRSTETPRFTDVPDDPDEGGTPPF